jgi:transposase
LRPVLEQKIAKPIMAAQKENLCADAGYAGDAPKQVMIAAGYEPHVRPRGEERKEKISNSLFQARRWVVEACHSWFNRFRKLAIRYEKLDETHLALHHLAAAIIALRKGQYYLRISPYTRQRCDSTGQCRILEHCLPVPESIGTCSWQWCFFPRRPWIA